MSKQNEMLDMILNDRGRIKFRAWNAEYKEMSAPFTFGYVLRFGNKFKSITHEVILRYVGIKDIHGEDVYEGDILKAHGVVAWNEVELMWSRIDLNWNDKRLWHNLESLTSPIEIIGNVFSNPELLE